MTPALERLVEGLPSLLSTVKTDMDEESELWG